MTMLPKADISLSPSEAVHDRKTAFCLFLFLLCLYITTASGHLYTMDDQTQFAVLESVWSHHSFAIAIPDNERHLNTSIGRNGQRYAYYGIGGAVILAPFYLLGRAAGFLFGHSYYLAQASVALVNTMATALAAAFLFLLARHDGRPYANALRAALLYGVASTALVWARTQNSSVWVGTIFVMAAWLMEQKQARSAGLAGMLCGLAFNARFDALPGVILILALPILRRDIRATAAGVAGFLPWGLLAMFYNVARFGSPWNTGYPELAGGGAFSTPLFHGLNGLLILPTRGLFWYAPIFLLLAFMRGVRRPNPRQITVHILLPLFYLLFFSRYIVWHGASTWGPRFLGCCYPLLAYWLAFVDLDTTSRRRLVGRTIIAISLLIQIWGTLASVDSYHDLLTEQGINPIESATNSTLAPLWGIRHVIADFQWERPVGFTADRALPAGGYAATRNLRATPDYWPFYAWKVGVPATVILTVWLFVAFATVASGIRLLRAAREATSSRLSGT